MRNRRSPASRGSPDRTSAVANHLRSYGRPALTNEEAWDVYDGFLADDRVRMFPELPILDDLFRSFSSLRQASPKVWVDAYLAAHASANDAILVTFDQAWLAMEPNAGSWARLSCDPCYRAGPSAALLLASGWLHFQRLNARQHSSVSRSGVRAFRQISQDTDVWNIYLLKPTCARSQGTSFSKVNRFPS
jgi:hypothetical protein